MDGWQCGRVLLEAECGQAGHARHRVHPLQPSVLARHHGGGHLAAVVLVDDAVLRPLHDLDVLQVLATWKQIRAMASNITPVKFEASLKVFEK